MNDVDYQAVLEKAFGRFLEANDERCKLDLEIAKLRQFIMATIGMLPESDRTPFLELMNEFGDRGGIKNTSLKDAVLGILRAVYPNYLTVAGLRDRLKVNAFDFSEYTSDPLASISTTLRRLKPNQVETTTQEGVTAYRLNKKPVAIVPRKGFGDRKPVTGGT